MPQTRPTAIARKMKQMSRAEPGALRKRTSENAPATATPAPTLPLTIMMTTATMAGRMESASTKERVARPFREYTHESRRPRTRAAAMAASIGTMASEVVVEVVANRDSSMWITSPIYATCAWAAWRGVRMRAGYGMGAGA